METIFHHEVIPLGTIETYSQEPFKLIVHNDEIHSFDYVIECLVVYLLKDALEAMCLTSEIHFTGRAIVLGAASKSELQPIYDALTKKGLTCSIE